MAKPGDAPLDESVPTPRTPTEPAGRRHPLVRFGTPFVAIAVIAGIIVLLSKPWDGVDKQDSAELRAAKLGALEPGAPKKGEPAPDFALRTLDGDVIRLSELRGRPVLINFWATWCGPCRAEMPDIQAVYEQNKDSLVVLAVNVEGVATSDAMRLARDFRDELGLTFPIVFDSPDGDVSQQYRLKGYPDSFFVDSAGILRDFSFGPMSKDTMLKKLAATRDAGS